MSAPWPMVGRLWSGVRSVIAHPWHRDRRLWPLTILVLTWLALATACTAFPSPIPNNSPGTAPEAVAPDIEATIQAAVATAVQEALPGSTPNPEPDPEATIAARVQATIEALLATPAVPVSAAALSPVASTPVPTPEAHPTLVVAQDAVEPAAPNPTPATTPEATTLATPTLGAQPPTPTPNLAPTAINTPVPQPTPTLALASNCQPAADGTVVTAWIDADQVAETTVTDGSFVLFVEQPEGGSFAGHTIAFKIGGLDADQTASWASGGGDQLGLTATAQPLLAPTPTPLGFGSRRYSPSGVLAQPVPPHLFLGTATLCTPS